LTARLRTEGDVNEKFNQMAETEEKYQYISLLIIS
jgi:hypothetical protein